MPQAFEEAEADRHKFKARDPAVLYGTPRLPKKAEQALTQPKSPKLSTDMRARARGASLTREQLEQAGGVAFAARPVPATRTFELKPSVKVRRTALVLEPMRESTWSTRTYRVVAWAADCSRSPSRSALSC